MRKGGDLEPLIAFGRSKATMIDQDCIERGAYNESFKLPTKSTVFAEY